MFRVIFRLLSNGKKNSVLKRSTPIYKFRHFYLFIYSIFVSFFYQNKYRSDLGIFFSCFVMIFFIIYFLYIDVPTIIFCWCDVEKNIFPLNLLMILRERQPRASLDIVESWVNVECEWAFIRMPFANGARTHLTRLYFL